MLFRSVSQSRYITKQVEVISIGDTRILTPIGKRWELWMNTPSQLTEDCFQEREQPIVQERESF